MPMAKKAPPVGAAKGKPAKQNPTTQSPRPGAQRKAATSPDAPRTSRRSTSVADDEGVGIDVPGSQRPPDDS